MSSNFDLIATYVRENTDKSYEQMLNITQQFVVRDNLWEQYKTVDGTAERKDKVLSYIKKCMTDNNFILEGYTPEQLQEKLYNDIDQYSILTPYLYERDDIEEININAWNDIQIITTSGQSFKSKEKFLSPEHACDIVKKLLQRSAITMDYSQPKAEGDIDNHIRIAAMQPPLISKSVGVAAEIRILRKQSFSAEEYYARDFASKEELEFLSMAANYGVSMILAGRTSSGKTTQENFILDNILHNKRIFTIETGARELYNIQTDEQGEVINNVIHSKTSDSVNQEDLVATALRFNPDLICLAEVRDKAAYAAQEASETGHTVITSLHAGGPQQAHIRIANLCRKVYPIDFHTALIQAASAFPIVAFIHKCEDKTRRIMSITEAVVNDNQIKYVPIFRFDVERTDEDEQNGKKIIVGKHNQVNYISQNLIDTLKLYGVPNSMLDRYIKKE